MATSYLNNILPLSPQNPPVDISTLGTKIKLDTNFWVPVVGYADLQQLSFATLAADDKSFGKTHIDDISNTLDPIIGYDTGGSGYWPTYLLDIHNILVRSINGIDKSRITAFFDDSAASGRTDPNIFEFASTSYWPSYPLQVGGKRTIVYLQSYSTIKWGPKTTSANARDDSQIIFSKVNYGMEIITQTFSDANTYSLTSIKHDFIDATNAATISCNGGTVFNSYDCDFSNTPSWTAKEFAIPAGLTFSNNSYRNVTHLNGIGGSTLNYFGKNLYDYAGDEGIVANELGGLTNTYNGWDLPMACATIE